MKLTNKKILVIYSNIKGLSKPLLKEGMLIT